MTSIPVLKNVHINKGNGFVAAYNVIKLLACTQMSFSFSFRQQSRIQERARKASAELEEEKERTSVLWTSLGEKSFIKSIPWQLRILLLPSFLTPTPLCYMPSTVP